MTIGFYEFCRRQPRLSAALLKHWAKVHLPKDFDYDKHLTPPYKPWDQRLCVVPSADLFKAVHSHKVDVVTDHIERFTEDGIRLKSGGELTADIVVTATGLNVIPLGGMVISVDGENMDIGGRFSYKALMLDGIPNFAFIVGYSNASWTLKADLVCEYVVRLLDYMDENNYSVVVPRAPKHLSPEPAWNLTSGYLARAEGALPVGGDKAPWRLKHNWYFDKRAIRHSKIDDDGLVFTRADRARPGGLEHRGRHRQPV
jgi:monooxygenase